MAPPVLQFCILSPNKPRWSYNVLPKTFTRWEEGVNQVNLLQNKFLKLVLQSNKSSTADLPSFWWYIVSVDISVKKNNNLKHAYITCPEMLKIANICH